MFKQLFARKSLEMLHAEAEGDNRLRRILGPITLTSLGIGAIIGSGIFVMTGRVAANDAGPAIMLSFVFAGLGCLFAALCYAEFASMAPVAGSAYTYAYATLGELLAWIIGWDLVLEYAMACAVVAAGWAQYLNKLLHILKLPEVPAFLIADPFSSHFTSFLNLPAMLITLVVTVILVIGIRESATTNAILVAVKVGVVLFVIFVGIAFIDPSNWTGVDPHERNYPEDVKLPELIAKDLEKETEGLPKKQAEKRTEELTANVLALAKIARETKGLTGEAKEKKLEELKKDLATSKYRDKELELDAKVASKSMTQEEADKELKDYAEGLVKRNVKNRYFPLTPKDEEIAQRLFDKNQEGITKSITEKWGILGLMGFNKQLAEIDDKVRSPFAPYGLAGIVFGASLVFFAYIGFDAISTHSEEAKKPQRDVPIAILASLLICTVLYIAVAAVLTGMAKYQNINPDAAIASAFDLKAEEKGSALLKAAAGLIAIGALAGLTSVLLITFLSQARIFLAMARDGLLPPSIFGAIHPRFRTPHISTMLTGGIIAVVAAFTPISVLEEMVNIGTLMAFVIVCAAVFMLRFQRPNAVRPFRAPLIWIVAPLGILINLSMMLFLQLDTWIRLVVWLAIGLVIYFGYGMSRSTVGKLMNGLPPQPAGGGAPH